MAAALPLVTLMKPQEAPALERLSQLDTVYVHQTGTGYRGNNYTVFGKDEEVLLTLDEIVPDTPFRGGAHRAFKFEGVDSTGRKLFSFNRPIGMICITNRVELFMNEALVITIRLARTFCKPIFNISDAQDNPVIRLKGQLRADYFQLQTPTRAAIGGVQKKDLGWRKEMASYKDDYIIYFPSDLAVPYKIAVIVACVFIDFRFHEGNK